MSKEWIKERAKCNLRVAMADLYKAAKEAVEEVNSLPAHEYRGDLFQIDPSSDDESRREIFTVTRTPNTGGDNTVCFEWTEEKISISGGLYSMSVKTSWDRDSKKCQLTMEGFEGIECYEPDELIEKALGFLFFGN